MGQLNIDSATFPRNLHHFPDDRSKLSRVPGLYQYYMSTPQQIQSVRPSDRSEPKHVGGVSTCNISRLTSLPSASVILASSSTT